MPPPSVRAFAALTLSVFGALAATAEEAPGDPILAALEGRAPAPWTAERLLRDTMIPWAESADDVVDGGSREPALHAETTAPPLTEHLAAFVPADAAVAFFDSVDAADDACASVSRLLVTAFPDAFGARPDGEGELVLRTIDRLGLPPIWRANPGVRTGLRRIAVVVDDVDLSGAAGVALIGEVDDLSLLLGHRRAGFRWEDGHRERFRVDGLDAATDDGAVRSFFAYEGGIAVFSTSRALRDRILARVRGASPDGAAVALSMNDTGLLSAARVVFPAEAGDALLLVPDGFLVAAVAPKTALRRSRATRCSLERLRADGVALRRDSPSPEPPRITAPVLCPEGGSISPQAGAAGASCTVHGSAVGPVPLSDVTPSAPPDVLEAEALRALAAHAVDGREGALAAVPPAFRLRPRSEGGGAVIEVLLSGVTPVGAPLPGWLRRGLVHRPSGSATAASVRGSLGVLARLGFEADARALRWFELTGRRLPTDTAGMYAPTPATGDGVAIPPPAPLARRGSGARVLVLRAGDPPAAEWR